MATLGELSTSLLTRFKDVPNVTSEDTDAWVERSFLEHGFDVDEDVAQDTKLLVLLYAEWDATLQIALKSAYYFEYKDAEESVDKRSVSEQYRRIAAELKKRYDAKKSEGAGGIGGSQFSIMRRADR